MYRNFCVHFSVEGHLCSFRLLAIINEAAMNLEHEYFLHVGASSRYTHKSSIAASSGSTVSNFLSNHQTDFQSGFINLSYHHVLIHLGIHWKSTELKQEFSTEEY